MPNALYDVIEYFNCRKIAEDNYLVHDNNNCGSIEQTNIIILYFTLALL